jgi:uncharacterized repeat protein (TIGR03803 family)
MHGKERFHNAMFSTDLRPHNVALTITLALLFLIFLIMFITLTAPPAQGQTFNVIYSFTGGSDGAYPHSGLTRDARGNLYGTDGWLGDSYGTVYQLIHNASGWHFNALYAFSGPPGTRVVFGPGGSLYGASFDGGNGYGTVFSIIPPPDVRENHWIGSVLYSFTYSDGAYPTGPPVFDQAGNIYGGTQRGGSYGSGAVYKLTRSGNTWNESVLYSFTGGDDGLNPVAVTFQAGDLYGTTNRAGTYGDGTVFQLTPSGSGWTENTLYAFPGGSGGGFPASGVIFDSAGNMYGSSASDGSYGSYGPGSVWEVMPSGGSWTFSTLYNFSAPGCGSSNGPTNAPLTMDQAGNLYGTTVADGAYCAGTVFKLSPPSGGGQWTYTYLHDFTAGSDGGYPWSNVIIGPNGNLYGTATSGGANGYGVVWEITP